MKIPEESVALINCSALHCQPTVHDDWFQLVGRGRRPFRLQLAFNRPVDYAMHALSNYHVVIL